MRFSSRSLGFGKEKGPKSETDVAVSCVKNVEQTLGNGRMMMILLACFFNVDSWAATNP